jgi:Chromate transporter
MDQVPALARVFAYLSLLTIGGGMAAFPAMQSSVVDVHHWLTHQQLIHIYSVGQMAPGPNMMMVATVGERVAGVGARWLPRSRFSCRPVCSRSASGDSGRDSTIGRGERRFSGGLPR